MTRAHEQPYVPHAMPEFEGKPLTGEDAWERDALLLETPQELADYLIAWPNRQDVIVSAAAKCHGNHFVNEALRLVPTPAPAEKAKETKDEAGSDDGAEANRRKAYDGMDATRLAELIRLDPFNKDAMVAEATVYLGQSAVREALAMVADFVDTSAETTEAAAPSEETVAEAVSEAEPTPPAVIEEEVAAVETAPEGAVEPAVEPTKEPGWVTRARAYNEQNATNVQIFNEVTAWSCCPPKSTDVDPYLVARWQQKHGLDPDGRVGPDTANRAIVDDRRDMPDVALAPNPEAP